MKGEVEELVLTFERALVDILANSRMKRSDVELEMLKQGSLNNVAIHCCPQSPSQIQSLSCLFTNELIQKGLGFDGTLEVRHMRLRRGLH